MCVCVCYDAMQTSIAAMVLVTIPYILRELILSNRRNRSAKSFSQKAHGNCLPNSNFQLTITAKNNDKYFNKRFVTNVC